MTVPTPPGFAYYSGIVLLDNSAVATIWRIAITGYVVIALLCVLAAARDGTVGVVCIDHQMGVNGQDVLVSLPSGIFHEVDGIGLFEIISDSSFLPAALLIAWGRSSEVDGT